MAQIGKPDVIVQGKGPDVLLLHSSVAGARQWRKIATALVDDVRSFAVNLYGYGATPPWPDARPQTLDDQAALCINALPAEGPVSIVGHSFGGAVAMRVAQRLGDRVDRLILIEPNPFRLLASHGRTEALDRIQNSTAPYLDAARRGAWDAAGRWFSDYWNGTGSWDAMPEDRRAAFLASLAPNRFEYDAVFNDETRLETYVATLPNDTLVLYDPATQEPIRELVAIFREQTPWRFETLVGLGHMAPLTHPDKVAPILARELVG